MYNFSMACGLVCNSSATSVCGGLAGLGWRYGRGTLSRWEGEIDAFDAVANSV